MIYGLARARVSSAEEVADLLVKDVDVGRYVDLPLLDDGDSLGNALVLPNKHIDLILHVGDHRCQVLDSEINPLDVLASVIANSGRSFTRRRGNRRSDHNGSVGAVDEDGTIARVVVVHVTEEAV